MLLSVPFHAEISICGLNANISVSALLPETHKPPGQLSQETNIADCNCEFLSEGPIRCTLFKYLFPFVGEANPLPYFLQAVNIDCHRG